VVAPYRFRAPWASSVKALSVVGTLAIGVPAIVQLAHRHFLIGAILLAVLFLPAALTVRGYEISGCELRIRRLWWNTRWPLDDTTTASVAPDVMAGSLRTWGIGGLFSISGHFTKYPLDGYRAFVTDPYRTVVVRTKRGVVVVSPDRPTEFAAAVMASVTSSYTASHST